MCRLMKGSWTTGSLGVISVWLRRETAERNATSITNPGSSARASAGKARRRRQSESGEVTARRVARSVTIRPTASASSASTSTVIAFLVEKKPVTSSFWAPLGIEDSMLFFVRSP
jgi:hypothetical protein